MSKRIGYLLSLLIVVTLLATSGQAYANQRDDIVSAAREQLGVKYRFGGSSPSTGFDCSGFIYYVFSNAGITLPRTSAEQYNTGEAVSKSDLKKGDLVFFTTYRSGPSHSGIYVGDNKFIHASSSNGISISSINDPHYWGPRYLGAKRVLDEEVEQLSLTPLPLGYFHDVAKNHWAFDDIKNLTVEGVINGYAEGLFNPEGLVTRAQAATLIANVNNLKATKSTNISDVPTTHWASSAIQATIDTGIFQVADGQAFQPNKAMTRAEVAVLFTRAYELTDKEEVKTFKDVPSTHWAYDGITKAASNGLVNGFNDNTFRPNENVTRAQFARILHRAIDK